MEKLRKILVPAYIVFLVLSFLYVRSVLKGVPVSVQDNSDEKSLESKPVIVSLTVRGVGQGSSYSQKLTTNDSVSDLLLSIKEEVGGFTFDRISYSYGSEFDHVNNIKNTGDMKWKVYDGAEDITLSMDEIKLEDGKNYTLIYEKSTQTSTPQ